jgi:hypothetical protein
MACATATTMRFRLYTLNINLYTINISSIRGDIHNSIHHSDTGIEFTITPEDVDDYAKGYQANYGSSYGLKPGINANSIASIMLKKVYGFTARIYGHSVTWATNRAFIEDAISDRWYIKRVV